MNAGPHVRHDIQHERHRQQHLAEERREQGAWCYRDRRSNRRPGSRPGRSPCRRPTCGPGPSRSATFRSSRCISSTERAIRSTVSFSLPPLRRLASRAAANSEKFSLLQPLLGLDERLLQRLAEVEFADDLAELVADGPRRSARPGCPAPAAIDRPARTPLENETIASASWSSICCRRRSASRRTRYHGRQPPGSRRSASGRERGCPAPGPARRRMPPISTDPGDQQPPQRPRRRSASARSLSATSRSIQVKARRPAQSRPAYAPQARGRAEQQAAERVERAWRFIDVNRSHGPCAVALATLRPVGRRSATRVPAAFARPFVARLSAAWHTGTAASSRFLRHQLIDERRQVARGLQVVARRGS